MPCTEAEDCGTVGLHFIRGRVKKYSTDIHTSHTSSIPHRRDYRLTASQPSNSLRLMILLHTTKVLSPWLSIPGCIYSQPSQQIRSNMQAASSSSNEVVPYACACSVPCHALPRYDCQTPLLPLSSSYGCTVRRRCASKHVYLNIISPFPISSCFSLCSILMPPLDENQVALMPHGASTINIVPFACLCQTPTNNDHHTLHILHQGSLAPQHILS